MSLQDSLTFIRHCRESIKTRPLDNEYLEAACLDELLSMAEKAGFHFSRDDLLKAHRLDFQMRLQRFAATPVEN